MLVVTTENITGLPDHGGQGRGIRGTAMISVLHRLLLVLAGALLAAGALLLFNGVPRPGWDASMWGAILLAALLCERWRYRQIEHPSAGNWQRTGARFEDPETGQIVEVLYDPASGECRYAPVSGPETSRK